MPVEELATRITYSEFLGWLDFLQWREARTSKADQYLAQIAAEVRRGYVKHPGKVNTKDFILQFKQPSAPSNSGMAAKVFWLKALNIGNN